MTDVWQALDTRLDASLARPRLGDWVEIRTFELPRGNSYAMAANRRELVFYRLTPAEAAAVELMDGTRTVAELVVDDLGISGELDAASIVGLARLMYEGNFLTDRYVDVDAAVTRALHPPRPFRDGLDRFIRTLTLEWSGAERLTSWLYRHGLRFAFRRPGQILAGLVAIAGLIAFITATQVHHFTLTTQSVGVGFVVLMAMNLTLIAIHELGHATVLVHYRRRVKSAGFRVYFGAPSFFIDSSDVLMLSRGQRIVQAFAGPYFEAVAAGVSSFALLAFPTGAPGALLYRFCLLNYIVLFENLVPLLELDGYWILSDALQIPDLRPKSLAFLRRDVWSKLRHLERWNAADVGLALYATAGFVFTVACFFFAYVFWKKTFGGLVSKMWHAGPVGVALLIVLALFLTGPLLRALGRMIAAVGRQLELWLAAARFRAQSGWRIAAAELLDAQPMFADLPVEALNDLAGRVRRRVVGAGRIVIRQRERADAFYLVRRGTLEVVEHDRASDEHRVVRRVGAGEAFGEFGLAEAAPRTATVRTTSRTELFVVHKGDFDRLLADKLTPPAFPTTIAQLEELHALPPFTQLSAPDLQILADGGAWVTVAPGTDLIRQGEPGEAMFTLASGRAEVIIDGQTVQHRGPGEHVGEVALLLDQPRNATVRALTPVRAFALGRAGFEQLMRESFTSGTLNAHVGTGRMGDH